MPATTSLAARVAPSGLARTVDPGLSMASLLGLVDDMVAAKALWSHLVAHDPDERVSTRLIGSELYEVWLLGWTPGQRVELHDHGPSQAAIRVVEGELTEIESGRFGLTRRTLPVGSRRTVRSGTVHDVLNESAAIATSIHAYSPPLSMMTFYDPTDVRPVRSEPVGPAAAVLDGVFGTVSMATVPVAGRSSRSA